MTRHQKSLDSDYQPKDGSYLVELLLSKGYEVYGLIRRTSSFNRERLDHIIDNNFKLIYGDMVDTSSLLHIMKDVRPDEIYHLAGMSHVQVSQSIPEYTFDTNGEGATRLLEAVRLCDLNPCIYNAATSELFGGCRFGEKLNEESPFNPRSPYAISKLYTYWIMRHYREAYGLKTWNGILFNHESPRRGENFVTRKITLSIARIMAGKQKELVLGNTQARRDWGYAPDYVKGMWMMLQSKKPDDFVLATSEMHSVQEFLDRAMQYAGTKVPVITSRTYLRPTDVDALCGDYSKAKRVFGWEPKVRFNELVRIMMKADLKRVGL